MQIAVFFFFFNMANGLLVPYLPSYFRSLGFHGEQIGFIWSLPYFALIFVPPVWGWIADRTQKPAMLLKLACVLAVLGFSPMLWVKDYAGVVLVMAIYAVLVSPVTPLADTIAVSVATRLGTEYGKLRLWGSIGYIVSVWCFSAWLTRFGGALWQIVPTILTLMVCYIIASRFIQPPETTLKRNPPTFADARRLLSDRSLVLFFLAELVHWGALSAYYLLYTIHLQDLKADAYVGLGHSLAAGFEVLLMWSFGAIRKRVPLLLLLGIASVLTTARWVIVSRVESGPALAAVQILHCFSFGTCYVGSIAYIERTVPAKLLATGRALFASVVMGLGGVLGNIFAGRLYDYGGGTHGGGKVAFTGAAVLELLVPLLLIASWLLAERKTPQEAGGTASPAADAG